MGDPARGVEVRVPTWQLGTKRAPVSSAAADNGTKSQVANLALVGNLNERFHRIPGMLMSLHAKQQLVMCRRVPTRQLGRGASSGSPSHLGQSFQPTWNEATGCEACFEGVRNPTKNERFQKAFAGAFLAGSFQSGFAPADSCVVCVCVCVCVWCVYVCTIQDWIFRVCIVSHCYWT
jgi:hypothetical protein